MDATTVFFNHLPFIIVTVLLPLVGAIYISIRHIYTVVRDRRIYPVTGEAYSIYLLLALAGLIVLGLVFFRVAYDYTYTSMELVVRPDTGQAVMVTRNWVIIKDLEDLNLYIGIVDFLRVFYFLAGVTIGLGAIPLMLRMAHKLWMIEVMIFVFNPLMFVYLEIKPLQRMKYSYALTQGYNLSLRSSPYNDYAYGLIHFWFPAGLILGLIISVSLLLFVRRWAVNLELLKKY
ncbi:MAG: hypothetical protein GSR81_05175 [Desulfurococcales archaeon]|nr:hypothetical protein [Desulfurococcales archaeon]